MVLALLIAGLHAAQDRDVYADRHFITVPLCVCVSIKFTSTCVRESACLRRSVGRSHSVRCSIVVPLLLYVLGRFLLAALVEARE